MPDVFRKVRSGEPLAIPAAAYNAFIDAALAHRQQGMGAGDTIRGFHQAGIVPVLNASGQDKDRFDILGIAGPVVYPAENLDEFTARVALRCVEPTETHVGRFVVLLDPISDGAIGRGCVDGVCVTRVRMIDECDRFADIPEDAGSSSSDGDSGSQPGGSGSEGGSGSGGGGGGSGSGSGGGGGGGGSGGGGGGGGGGGSGDNCLLYGTMVRLADGRERPIETLRPGDRVMSVHLPDLEADVDGSPQYAWLSDEPLSKSMVTTAVVATVSHGEHDGFYVINRRIMATFEHPFLVRRGDQFGFCSADLLRIGDRLVLHDLQEEPIESIQRCHGIVATVSLHVPGSNTYLAGGAWVHNAAPSAGVGSSSSSSSSGAASSASSASGGKTSGSSFSRGSSSGSSSSSSSGSGVIIGGGGSDGGGGTPIGGGSDAGGGFGQF